MRRFLFVLILSGTLVVGTFCATLYKYRSDKTAWEEVQRGLVRLHSGLQFESVIALRSHLADADTALKLYLAEWRTYPPGRTERVRNAQQSLGYINSALDWQTRSGSREDGVLDGASVRALESYPDVTSNLSRSCAAGQIHITSTAASSAFAVAGISLLGRSEYPDTLDTNATPGRQFPPLKFEKETAECQRQENARKENETKKYWAQFRYHFVLKLLPSAPGSCKLVLRTDGGFEGTVELQPGHTKEFGANHDAMLVYPHCYGISTPDTVLRMTMNGHPYTPARTDYGYHIVPSAERSSVKSEPRQDSQQAEIPQ